MDAHILKSQSMQYEQLRNAVNSGDLIFITGLPNTGKTTLAKYIFKEHPKFISVQMNCYEIPSPVQLYHHIITALERKLKPRKIPTESKILSKVNIERNFVDFFEEFRIRALKKSFNKIFLVLDQVEFFKKTPLINYVINMITMIKDLYFIIITNDLYDFLGIIKSNQSRSNIQDRSTIIELTPFTKNDIIELVCRHKPTRSVSLYEKFVNNVVVLVYSSYTKDYVEIRTLCQDNFESFLVHYKESIKNLIKQKEKRVDDLTDEELDEYVIDRIHLGSIISSFFKNFSNLLRGNDIQNSLKHDDINNEVATNTSILIVAAYIAAYTKPTHDKINFVKLQKKRSRRNFNEDDFKPKQFTLERLIQIYRVLEQLSRTDLEYTDVGSYQVCSSRLSDSVLSDVQLLEDLRMINAVFGDGLDSLTRYKISKNLSKDYVARLAKQVYLDLDFIYGLSKN